jgi:hypothetical protein
MPQPFTTSFDTFKDIYFLLFSPQIDESAKHTSLLNHCGKLRKKMIYFIVHVHALTTTFGHFKDHFLPYFSK